MSVGTGTMEADCLLLDVSGIEAQVCKDISDRQQHGIKKYGTTVDKNPLSLEQWLQHAYEECLDQAVYLKKAIKEEASRTHNTVLEDTISMEC